MSAYNSEDGMNLLPTGLTDILALLAQQNTLTAWHVSGLKVGITVTVRFGMTKPCRPMTNVDQLTQNSSGFSAQNTRRTTKATMKYNSLKHHTDKNLRASDTGCETKTSSFSTSRNLSDRDLYGRNNYDTTSLENWKPSDVSSHNDVSSYTDTDIDSREDDLCTDIDTPMTSQHSGMTSQHTDQSSHSGYTPEPTSLSSMVQEVDFPLDELILRIFEEDDDAFYFPVKTQKEAKAFVRTLNIMGMQYLSIAQEVGEFEHNLTAWRKGLGRVGIGQRVIKRLNQPLQDLLDDEEEYNVDLQKLLRRNSSVTSSSQLSGRTSVSSVDRVSLCSSEVSVDQLDRLSATDRTSNISNISNNQDDMSEDSDSDSSSHHQSQDSPRSSPTPTPTHTKPPPPSQPTRPKSPTKPSSPTPTHTPVKLRKVEAAKPEISVDADPANVILRRAGSLRHVNRPEPVKVEKKEDSEGGEDSEVSMSVAERIRSYNSPKLSRRQISSTGSDTPSSVSTSRETSVEPDMHIDTSSPVPAACSPPVSPLRTEKSAPLRNGTSQQDERASPEPKANGEMKSVSDRMEELRKRVSGVNQDQEPEQYKRNSDIPQDEPQTNGRDSREDHVDNGTNGRPTSQNNSRRSSVCQSVDSNDSSAVDENYNSDLDPDNEGQSPVMAKLVQKISSMRAGQRNQSGYIYVLTDSPESEEEIRIKVGSSRCPEKRLRQARCFNPEMVLHLSIPVTARLSALSEAASLLQEYMCPELTYWYEAPRDVIKEAIQTVAEKFPSKLVHTTHDDSTC